MGRATLVAMVVDPTSSCCSLSPLSNKLHSRCATISGAAQMAPPDPCCAMPLCAMLLSLSVCGERRFCAQADEKKRGQRSTYVGEGGSMVCSEPRAFFFFFFFWPHEKCEGMHSFLLTAHSFRGQRTMRAPGEAERASGHLDATTTAS